MGKRRQRSYDAAFKAQVAVAALLEGKTLAQVGRRFGVQPVLVGLWKKRLLERAAATFERLESGDSKRQQDELLRKIGELTVERDALARGLGVSSGLSLRVPRGQPGPALQLPEGATLKEMMQRLERQLVESTLLRCRFNKERTARELGLARSSLFKRLKDWGLNP
jgi:transposase-like protein